MKQYEFKKIDEIEKIYTKHLKDLENLSNKAQEFCNDCKILDVNFVNTSNLIIEASKEIETLFCKLKDPNEICAIFGKTSSGKSSFVNYFLQQQILPTGNGPVTKCLIEIHKRNCNNESYIHFRNERTDINKFNEINDNSEVKDVIKVYVNSEIMPTNLIIYDTPGTDFDDDVDKEIVKKCRESDIILLMVPARSAIGLQERKFVQFHKTKFTKFNVIIVYTFWDEVCDEEDAEIARHKNQQLAQQFLIKELNMSTEEAKERVYFISIKKIMENRDDKWKFEYQQLYQKIVSQVNESHSIKRNSYLSQVENIIFELFEEMKTNLNSLDGQRLTISQKLTQTLELINHLNSIIIKIIEESSKEIFEQFLLITLKTVQENPEYDLTIMKELLNSHFRKLMERTKFKIYELINSKLNNQTNREHITQILDRIYSAFDFNLSKKFQDLEFIILHQYFLDIITIQTYYENTISIVVFALSGATVFTVIRTSMLLAAVMPITSACALSWGSKYGISRLYNTRFRTMWSNQEQQIRSMWLTLENNLKGVYIQSSNEISDLILPLKAELEKIRILFHPNF